MSHIRPGVSSSGLLLIRQPEGMVMIQPDRQCVDILLAFPSPSCKEDVLSLLGVLATLTLWLPGRSVTTVALGQLTMKNQHSQWSN